MKISDPYHAYYEHKIREFEEGIQAENNDSTTTGTNNNINTNNNQSNGPDSQTAQSSSTTTSTTMKASITTPIARFAMTKPTEAPHEFEFSLGHPSSSSGVTALDLEIIKLTAQYTATSGRDFLTGLAQREQRNPQFDFLKPTHLLFSYFTSLVDSYGKLLRPSMQLMERFTMKADRMKALECAVQRWEWTRSEEEKKRRENDDADQLAAVDWSEFAVVETIDFREDELLETVGMMTLNESNVNNNRAHMNEGEMDIDEGGSNGDWSGGAKTAYRSLQQLQHNRQDTAIEDDDQSKSELDIKVIADYTPRIAKSAPSLGTMTMIDPISGKSLPVSEMGEHMRVQLLDPKWRIEQQRFQAKQRETSYAEGSSIADSLQSFARKRGDIFGYDIKGIGKKI
jgi:splicing factor 3A subunit 1